ncbi:sensor histidine kinase KdpD [Lichenihabitans sp. Uapishka_5]|uniref:sensor histidine kinase KdpD n=1 Tax=Lichenihabitans sp. Uapishka_5 TaxID=3037302 RepID=UPI0029E82936|nr:sensor histidine kinase KdpD [Lichenihabitans sp. Uapishka_5]MDX7951744.1 sensor histidine kinase KdpD [Lichenihabitans sp. Uapishka_5]
MLPDLPSRRDPDRLLAAARRDERGHLKIFLGAAPGVGKTYAMLSNAKRLKLAHLDVVVGLVETHGRAETEALIDGLEVLPRRAMPYHGRDLAEFDLDAALARHPALMIVDELAHSNPPDSRHPKRHQDVAELLDAGIDVWTALNIQHLESLSDVVARLTGVTVRETVPDTVLEAADDVVVVDITPAELITRLSEGRIYRPETAARAANAFFKPGNLTALRELALRRTADRVDDQMVDHLRHNAIEGAWPTAERILVCIGGDPQSAAVLRAASRLASGLNAPLVALTIERTGAEVTDPDALRRIDETLRLAERLGAETARLAARDLPEAILRYAGRENVTQIVIGRSGASRWARLRGRSLSGALLRRAEGVAIHLITTEAPPVRRRPYAWPSRRSVGVRLAVAVGWVALAVPVGRLVGWVLHLSDASMVFLAAVLGCAMTVGQWPAVVAAGLSFLAYNFFFVSPIYTLTVAEPHELLALFTFLLVAVVTGGLTGRVRDQAQAAFDRATTLQALYDVSRKLARATGLDDVLWILARQAAAAVSGRVLVLLDEGRAATVADLAIRAAFPPEDELGSTDWAAARWAYERQEPAGWRTGTLPNAQFRFEPILTQQGVVGVVGTAPGDRSRPLPADRQRRLEALVDQGTLAIERARLAGEARRNEAMAERERLQTTLLSSLSHDLRTPLSSILGAATSLRSYGAAMSQVDRDDLLLAIEEDARRLARFVSNLLDMTRVEAGVTDLKRDWVEVADVLRGAVARAEKLFPDRRHVIRFGADLPLVRGDAVLLEQALFNLLDNADKYSPLGTATTVWADQQRAGVTIGIEDEGSGIPTPDLTRVFDKFTRVGVGDGRPAGTGLGLSVAKGVVEAMGGTVRAESPCRQGRGTCLLVWLPGAAASMEEGVDGGNQHGAGGR